jgi:putative Mg2+ transporter-C (MgtC) family protein
MSSAVFSDQLDAQAFFERLAVAVVLGVIIGLERQWRQRTGGLHIEALVCIGACLFTVAAPLLNIDGDRTRMAAGVISGIGFLAGSVIMREGLNVRGLITAATLWATAAVGVLIGLGFYMQGAVAALTVTILNAVLLPLAEFIGRHSRPHLDITTYYTVKIVCSFETMTRARKTLLDLAEKTALVFKSMTSVPADDGTVLITADASLIGHDNGSIDRIRDALKEDTDILSFDWKIVEQSR